MLERLERLTRDVAALHCKLILLVGAPRSGKTAFLLRLAKRFETEPLDVGRELGRQLAAVPQKQRRLQTGSILRELADQNTRSELLLLDNIEILFDRTLQLDPLDLLKRHAHARRIVAVWPGELRGDTRTGRLTYAETGHPEHRDYGLAGLVIFEMQ